MPAENQVQVWLVDQPGANANTAFALNRAARAVGVLRDERHRVLLHCAAGQSRTPAAGARYATVRFGKDGQTALDEMRTVLGDHGFYVNNELRQAVAAFG